MTQEPNSAKNLAACNWKNKGIRRDASLFTIVIFKSILIIEDIKKTAGKDDNKFKCHGSKLIARE
ncbi:hypothetical protein BHG07_14735 [Brenneria salicis ATCC 15712 = DSM 30166]|nr:hypothetical protein BHG07_14735 [Brenneria salicis ATCC 15712 = DSM 30166]